jgi:hypothetical protein
MMEEDVGRDLPCHYCRAPAWTETGYVYARALVDGRWGTVEICRRCWRLENPDAPGPSPAPALPWQLVAADPPGILGAALEFIAEQIRASRPDCPHRYASFQELVLDKGRPYRAMPLPPLVMRGPPGRCYTNTIALVRDPLLRMPSELAPFLTYVEGFAIAFDSGLAVHHAWAVDRHGQVWDRTWSDPEHAAYFGIPFDRDQLERFNALGEEYVGMLESDYLRRFPLLRTGELFPEEMPDAFRPRRH